MGVNILVAHGGGPTAVINTSLQGVVEGARASGKVDKIYAARFGAEGILKGESDYMVAIEGHRGEEFTFDLFLAPLAEVANVEKKFPLEWIIDGNRIDDRFFDYAMPLMMEKAPDYAILR